MRILTSATWASAQPRRAPYTAGPRWLDMLSALFAAGALAALALPVVIAQATDGASSARDTGAADPASVSRPSGSEWMFAGYTGVPYTYPSDVKLEKSGTHDLTVKQVNWEGRPFVNPIYYGARIVRWFEGGRTGAMLDFTHSKTIGRLTDEVELEGTLNGAPAPERAVLRDIFRRLEASHGHNTLALTGLARLPGIGLNIHPYVGLGAGVSLPHAEVHVAGRDTRTYEYQVAGPVGQALVGLELRTARVSYFIEYKFVLAPYTMPLTERDGTLLIFDLWKQFSEWMSGVEPPSGYASTTLASHQVVGGIGIRSAPAAAP